MITFTDLEKTVRELAAESPDNVYQLLSSMGGCCYERGDCSNGSVGCIFGQAFRRLSEYIPAEALAKYIPQVLDIMEIPATPKQRKWAKRVQTEQDAHMPWRLAVKIADADL